MTIPKGSLRWTAAFFDYCLSKTKLHSSKGYERARNYWLSDEAALPPAPDIPHFNSDMSAENAVFDRLHCTIAHDEWIRIRENITARGIQPYVLMLALYSKILALYSGSKHFTVNLPRYKQEGCIKERYRRLHLRSPYRYRHRSGECCRSLRRYTEEDT
jgi:hypothetical protein